MSYRHLEERMRKRGVSVDHSTINRWVLKYAPQLEAIFYRRKRPVSLSWRMDETYIKVRGHWLYLSRAVDKAGHTIDFLLTTQRDGAAALPFLTQAIGRHGVPETITIEGSELMHMVKTGQLLPEEGVSRLTPAEQFYALAA